MKRVSLLIVACTFALSGVGMAKEPGFGGGRYAHGKGHMGISDGKWWKRPQIAEKLALTQEEEKKLDTTYLQHRRQMIDLHSQMEKERLELEHLFDSSSFDPAACIERFKKLQEVQSNFATERFNFLIQVRELLGLERFQQLKAEFREHRMQGRHGRRHHPRGQTPVE